MPEPANVSPQHVTPHPVVTSWNARLRITEIASEPYTTYVYALLILFYLEHLSYCKS